ncbi:MAG: glucose 1-dehydrogenase [Acidobacteriia bacterium]|nr:glucose 1-dehydrogenase [Terriglobia bacterium]
MQLKGKSAIVTGGGKGIGKVFCEALAREGASVVVADIDAAAAIQTAERLCSAGARAVACKVDVSDAASTVAMAKCALEAFQRIDILVNNAALFAVLPHQPLWEIQEAEWDRVMTVNIKGMFLSLRAVLPQMKEQGSGKVINLTSATVFRGTPMLLHYVTSKAAVIGFTRCTSRELGPFGICVNAIAPGLTESETAVGAKTTPAVLFERLPKERAIARPELPSDLTGTLVYLASPASDFVTGQTIVVDGGGVMH